MVEIRDTPAAAAAVAARRDAREDAELEGRYRDEAVEVEIEADSLAEEAMEDAVEERVSEEVDHHLAREERAIVNEEATSERASEQARQHPQQDPRDARERHEEIEEIGRRFKEKGSGSNPEDLLEYMRENLGEQAGVTGPNHDPTLQYGAMAIVERMYAAEGDSAMAGAAGAAADRLLAEHGTEIHKGVIVSEAAALYASEHFATASDLRQLYMHEVVEHRSIPATFNNLLETHGEERFGDAVGFLLRAAGDDLATMPAGTDRLQQKEVLDNLYQLEVLNTMRERTADALEQVGRTYPLAPTATPQKVMRDTLGMVENPSRISESSVSKLAADSVPGPVQGRIAFLREYRGLAAMIPVRVFDEADGSDGGGLRLRQRMTDAIVQAQDVADADEQGEVPGAKPT